MIRTMNLFFWFGLSICASLALYHTSDRTRGLETQLRQINAAIEAEQEKIHVLNAEWVFLGNPARVEESAAKFLPLKPTSPRQVIGMDDLDQTLPTHDEKAAAANVPAPIAAPVSTVKVAVAAVPAPPARAHSAAHPRKLAVAIADHAHINDHMIMDHSVKPRHTDEIGELLAGLDTHQ